MRCFFALAWLLGLTAPVAVALASGSAFGLLAGGAHCTGFGRCLLSGLVVYLLAGLAGARLGSVLSPDGVFWLLAGGYLLCSLAAWRWAPGAAPDAYLSPPRRRMFKLLTLLYLQVFMAGAVYLVREGHSSLAVAGLAALVAQGASLTAAGYRLIGLYDRKPVFREDVDIVRVRHARVTMPMSVVASIREPELYSVVEAPGVTSYVEERLSRDLREGYERQIRELMNDPFPRRGKKTSWRLHGRWEGLRRLSFFSPQPLPAFTKSHFQLVINYSEFVHTIY